MAELPQTDREKKAEYLEILDDAIRTNPYRKAATAMASVMAKHGIESGSTAYKGPKGGPEKRCALTRSLRFAENCNAKLTLVKDDLQALCSHLSPTASKDNVGGVADKATMAGHLLTLIGEAETIAKRIYETALGLHVVEDFFRQPEDIKLLDFSTSGRIHIPNYSFNHASQLCLEWLHSTAFKWLKGFQETSSQEGSKFIGIFETFTKAMKDYTEAVCLGNQVFRVLLYANATGKRSLQEYILSLGHVLKNDVIMELQALRRAFDSIQYTLERIGWAASIAWMKYSGKNITVETLNESGIQVDHSTFQYKLYQGSKPGKKIVRAGNPKKAKSLKKVTDQIRGSLSSIAENEKIREKSASVHYVMEETERNADNNVACQKMNLVEFPPRTVPHAVPSTSAEGVSRRRSQSVSDIVRFKKLSKRKPKGKQLILKKAAQTHGDNLVESGPTNSSTVKTEYLKPPTVPLANTDSQSQQSLPPIPTSVQKQLTAVFGPITRAKARNKSNSDVRNIKLTIKA